MNWDLATAIRAMQGIAPTTLQLPAVKALVDVSISALPAGDQSAARDTYHDLIGDNDDGRARAQERLTEAARR